MKKQSSKQNISYKPDWTPENAGDEFAVRVVKGMQSSSSSLGSSSSKKEKDLKRKHLSIDDYVSGVLNFDRNILARAITLIESNNPIHHDTAQEVLKKLLPNSGKSLRIGITEFLVPAKAL